MRLAVLLIPGCKTAERVTYSHAPTENLLQTWNVADPALAPYRAAGVVVAPFVVPLDYDNTAIKVVFVADQPATVAVREAQLAGVGPPRILAADMQIVVDQPADRAGLVQRDVTVATIATADLDAMGANGLVLTLAVAGTDGTASTLTFTLGRHVETYLVSR
jgi:hypothetical protein